MPVLQSSEYDISYFNGQGTTYTHNAGYTDYSWVNYPSVSNRYVPTIEDSTGTIYGDLAKGLNINLNNRFIGKSVLVVGCAYGFEVKGFRDLGIDAWGIDVSAYAISQADPSIAPYLEVADARVKMPTYLRNQWDYIFSRWFLECMSDVDLATIIPDMNFACKNEQVHIINTTLRDDYYNTKSIAEWLALPFENKTILIPNDNFDEYVIK